MNLLEATQHEAFQSGIQEGIEKTAIQMIKEGIEKALVSRITGLSMNAVQNLVASAAEE